MGRADGLAGLAAPARVAVAVANGPVRAVAHLPVRDGDRPGLTAGLARPVATATGGGTDVAAIVNAVVVTHAKTDGRAVVPLDIPVVPRRAGAETVAATPPEVGLATPGVGRLVEAVPAPKEVGHVSPPGETGVGRVFAPPARPSIPPPATRLAAANTAPAFRVLDVGLAVPVGLPAPYEVPALGPTTTLILGPGGVASPVVPNAALRLPIADTALLAAPVVTPAQVAGGLLAGGDVAPGRSPVTPVPPTLLAAALVLRPLVVEGLDEGVHVLRQAILAMAVLPSVAQVALDAGLVAVTRVVGGVVGVPNGPAPDVLTVAVHVPTVTRPRPYGVLAGRPRPPMAVAPFLALRPVLRRLHVGAKVTGLAVLGARAPTLAPRPAVFPTVMVTVVVPSGTVTIVRPAVAAQVPVPGLRVPCEDTLGRAGAFRRPTAGLTPPRGRLTPAASAAVVATFLGPPRLCQTPRHTGHVRPVVAAPSPSRVPATRQVVAMPRRALGGVTIGRRAGTSGSPAGAAQGEDGLGPPTGLRGQAATGAKVGLPMGVRPAPMGVTLGLLMVMRPLAGLFRPPGVETLGILARLHAAALLGRRALVDTGRGVPRPATPIVVALRVVRRPLVTKVDVRQGPASTLPAHPETTGRGGDSPDRLVATAEGDVTPANAVGEGLPVAARRDAGALRLGRPVPPRHAAWPVRTRPRVDGRVHAPGLHLPSVAVVPGRRRPVTGGTNAGLPRAPPHGVAPETIQAGLPPKVGPQVVVLRRLVAPRRPATSGVCPRPPVRVAAPETRAVAARATVPTGVPGWTGPVVLAGVTGDRDAVARVHLFHVDAGHSGTSFVAAPFDSTIDF